MTTIFNVVVDLVVRHWEYLMAEGTVGAYRDYSSSDEVAQTVIGTIRARGDVRRWTEEGHTRLKVREAFFYTDSGMVASTNPGWLQTALDTLTGLFDWVGLQENVIKTAGMVCQPSRAAGVRSYEA